MTHSKRNAPDLTGMTILVTRPEHQAKQLANKIQLTGGNSLCFPVLAIKPALDQQALVAAIDTLDNYDWIVFISINAVEFALDAINAHRTLPSHLKIAVIGKSSAAAVERAGLTVDACPSEQFNSEGLLALPGMQLIKRQRFMVFRGNGGRELLADSLRERGALVHNVEAYRREKPDIDQSAVISAGQAGKIDVILINSIESLQNLVELLGSEQGSWLYNTPLLVVSPRIVGYARECGFSSDILVADNATDAAVIKTLLDWKTKTNKY